MDIIDQTVRMFKAIIVRKRIIQFVIIIALKGTLIHILVKKVQEPVIVITNLRNHIRIEEEDSSLSNK